jgi:hypothetical protein
MFRNNCILKATEDIKDYGSLKIIKKYVILLYVEKQAE